MIATVPSERVEAALVLTRAAEAGWRAREVGLRSQALVDRSRRLRDGRRGLVRYFVLNGRVDGRPVRATWFCGALHASALLVQRAELLVQLGEGFEAGPAGRHVAAALDAPLAAMLTMVRACDEVSGVRFGPLAGRLRAGAAHPVDEPGTALG